MEIVKRGMLNVAPVVVAAQHNCKYHAGLGGDTGGGV